MKHLQEEFIENVFYFQMFLGEYLHLITVNKKSVFASLSLITLLDSRLFTKMVFLGNTLS